MNESPTNCNRRTFIRNSGLTLVGLAVPYSFSQWSEWLVRKQKTKEVLLSQNNKVITPVKNIIKPESKVLSFYNTHTGEWLKDCAYIVNDRVDKQAMKAIQKLFRDHRSGTSHTIDLKLLNVLHKVQEKLETNKVYHLISGYRCQASNEGLRTQSNGVAKESMHTKGRAADIFLEHIDLLRIQKAALDLKSGGVGRYSQFIHLDSGRNRRWGLSV